MGKKHINLKWQHRWKNKLIYPVGNGVAGIGVGSFFSVDSKREGGGAIAAPGFGTIKKNHIKISKWSSLNTLIQMEKKTWKGSTIKKDSLKKSNWQKLTLKIMWNN